MPNWCTNHVTFTGPQSEIDLFLEQARKSYSYRDRSFEIKDGRMVNIDKVRVVEPEIFSFQNFVPMPESLHIQSPPPETGPIAKIAKENKEKYGFSDWYDWAIVNWGTKWDAGGTVLKRRSKRTIRLDFETAWSPPEAVLEAIHEQFPKLTIRLTWREEGGQKGWNVWEADPKAKPTLKAGPKRKKMVADVKARTQKLLALLEPEARRLLDV